MSISLSSDITSVMDKYNSQNASATKSASLENSLTHLSKNASDEELMNACKSFEAYLTEQVMTKVKDALVPKDEDDENEYMKMFGDKLYQEYANMLAESGTTGIAQQLYEAMKRDYGISSVKAGTEISEEAMATEASSAIRDNQ